MKHIIFGNGEVSLGKENPKFVSLSNFLELLVEREFLTKTSLDDRIVYSYTKELESVEAKAFLKNRDFIEIISNFQPQPQLKLIASV